MPTLETIVEAQRLAEARERAVPWKKWGLYHQTGWTGLFATLVQLFGTLDARAALEGGKREMFRGLATPPAAKPQG